MRTRDLRRRVFRRIDDDDFVSDVLAGEAERIEGLRKSVRCLDRGDDNRQLGCVRHRECLGYVGQGGKPRGSSYVATTNFSCPRSNSKNYASHPKKPVSHLGLPPARSAD